MVRVSRFASIFLAAGLPIACRAAPTIRAQKPTSRLIYITLEEHYNAPAIVPLSNNPVWDLTLELTKAERLADGENQNFTGPRLQNMDANNIRIQVVSTDPTPAALSNVSVVIATNDQVHTAVQQAPDRFRGFCFLPMAYPDLAAKELERCVMQLGFVGALIDAHNGNETYYDAVEYDVLWSMAQKLDVPIYLHPTYPPIGELNGTTGRFKPSDGESGKPGWTPVEAAFLATAGYSWHVDTGMVFVRLWLSGVFDRFPCLKIVLGHMGEAVPFMLYRTNMILGKVKTLEQGGISVLEAYSNNVWITTSGFFDLHPFHTLASVTAMDRIMVSLYVNCTYRPVMCPPTNSKYSSLSITHGRITKMERHSWRL
jgi:predicted TIM-barrel fold metal-dependent hydrolase